MELLHPATWRDHDTDFAKWLHTAMWYVALRWHAVEFAGGSTLQCDTSLRDHDIEFAIWQHPAMWQVALGWHKMEFAQTSAILKFYIWFRVLPYHRSGHYHYPPVCEILSKSDHPQQKKMTSYRFSRWRISAILDFMGPIMGSLKSPCMTSYRSSIDTIALNCLMFEKIAFLQFGDWHTNKQTNRWTASMHEASLALPSGGLITYIFLSRHRSSLQTDIDFVSLLLYIQIKCVGSKVCFFSLYA